MTDTVAEQIAALRDADWSVREDAAAVLGKFRDPRAVRPLIRSLQDTDKAVRDAAAAALEAIGEAAVAPLIESMAGGEPRVQELVAGILSVVGHQEAVDTLINALASPNWIVRMYAAKGLGRIGDTRAVASLFPLLQDKVKAVREETTLALSRFGTEAVPILVEALRHPEWLVRLHAIEALGRIKSADALEPLLYILFNDPDTSVREDAVRSLGAIRDPRAVQYLLMVLATPGIRPHAIEALGLIGEARAVPALVEVLTGRSRPEAGRPIIGCGDGYEEEMIAMEASVRALGRIRDPETIPTLVDALQNTVIRAEAAEALSQFGQAAIPYLLEMLRKERDANILYHVRETLNRVGWRANRVS